MMMDQCGTGPRKLGMKGRVLWPSSGEDSAPLMLNVLITLQPATPGNTNDLTLGCHTSYSASSSKFHHFALLVALVSHSSNFTTGPCLPCL